MSATSSSRIDEPTASLDPENRATVLQMIADLRDSGTDFALDQTVGVQVKGNAFQVLTD